MINLLSSQDAATAAIVALLGIIVLLVVMIIVAYRRGTRARLAYRRQLNQSFTGLDVARGHSLEETQVIVRRHRR